MASRIPPNQIASGIADQFFVVTSLRHEELRLLIMRAIKAERTVVRAELPEDYPQSGPIPYQGPPRIDIGD